MRPVCFLGDSLKCLRDFPQGARHDAGYQLDKVQRGDQPDDFKSMPSVGKGVEEIRVLDSSGAHRVIYFARRAGRCVRSARFPQDDTADAEEGS